MAQGAGVAIEDAVLLCKALQNQYNKYSNSNNSTTGKEYKNESEDKNCAPWNEITSAAISELDDTRRSRIQTLELFSDISQRLGHLNSPVLCKLRDTVFSLIPSAVKTLFFDQAIRIVSDDSHIR